MTLSHKLYPMHCQNQAQMTHPNKNSLIESQTQKRQVTHELFRLNKEFKKSKQKILGERLCFFVIFSLSIFCQVQVVFLVSNLTDLLVKSHLATLIHINLPQLVMAIAKFPDLTRRLTHQGQTIRVVLDSKTLRSLLEH